MTRPRKTPTQNSEQRFLQMLHHLGWSLGALKEPQPLAYGRSRMPRARWQAAPLPDGHFLVLLFIDEPLAKLETAFRSYEDLTPLHAQLRAALRELELVSRHVVLVDPEMNAQLIDMAREDILIEARGDDEVGERLLPILHLNKLASGSLAGFPRKSLSQRARELHDWTRVWASRLGSAAGTSREGITSFFHWLHLARLAEVLGLMSIRQPSFPDYGIMTRPPNPARYLSGIFRPLHESWNLLQGQSLGVQNEIAKKAHEAGQLLPCLESFSRISCSKFSAEVFAESFADHELRVTSWRQSLVDDYTSSEGDPARWLADPMVVDLDTAGFSGVLRQFDQITEDLRGLAREQAVLRERGQRPGVQMDVFGVEPPPMQEEDAPRTTMQLVLRVQTARRDRLEVARLVLLAHAAEWHARLRRPEPIFPQPQLIMTTPPASPQKPAKTVDPGMN